MKTLFVVLAVLATGTVSAQQIDTRIVDEGKLAGVQISAVAGNKLAPEYPAAFAADGDDVCIAMAYTVEPDGSTGDIKLLRAWSSDASQAQAQTGYVDAFAAQAIDVVAQWHFVQHDSRDARPVSTVATLSFEGKGKTRRLADRCRISQLANYYKAVGRTGLVAAARASQVAASRDMHMGTRPDDLGLAVGCSDFMDFRSSSTASSGSEP